MVSLFFITSIIFLVFGSYFHSFVKSKTLFDKISSLIYFTASVVYAFIGLIYLNSPYSMIRTFRYLDWFITVPLLLYQLYLFLDRRLKTQKDLILLIISSLGMLSFGLIGELGYLNKILANSLGSMFGAIIFYIWFAKCKKEDINFFIAVSILWLFYPIVYLIEESTLTLILFSLVDTFAKVGTGIFIRKKKSINLKKLI